MLLVIHTQNFEKSRCLSRGIQPSQSHSTNWWSTFRPVSKGHFKYNIHMISPYTVLLIIAPTYTVISYIYKTINYYVHAANRLVSKRKLLAKFACWQRGDNRLDFGWWTLGKRQWMVFRLSMYNHSISNGKFGINSWLPWLSVSLYRVVYTCIQNAGSLANNGTQLSDSLSGLGE